MTNIVQFPSTKEVTKEPASVEQDLVLSLEDRLKIKVIVLLMKEHTVKGYSIEQCLEAFGCTEEQLTKMAYGEVDKLSLKELLSIVDSAGFTTEVELVNGAQELMLKVSTKEV